MTCHWCGAEQEAVAAYAGDLTVMLLPRGWFAVVRGGGRKHYCSVACREAGEAFVG